MNFIYFLKNINSTYLSIEFKSNNIIEFNYSKELIPNNLKKFKIFFFFRWPLDN